MLDDVSVPVREYPEVPDFITAYHEAAHAVTGENLVSGVVDQCSIEGCLCGQHVGWHIIGEVTWMTDVWRLKDVATMTCAAWYGVKLVADPSDYFWTFGVDRDQLLRWENREGLCITSAYEWAQKKVEKLEPQIHRVAKELLKRPTLTGREIRELL